MAVNADLEVFRGEQVSLDFTMDPVVDIFGWTIQFTVAEDPNSETKVIPSQTASIVNSAAGTFRVTLTEELLALTPASYYYDVWRTDEGFEQVLAYGVFTVNAVARIPV